MIRKTLMSGAAAVALLALPGMAFAQDPSALEARIAQLEAQLSELKSEVAASRAQQTAQQQAVAQDIVRIEQRAAAAPPAPLPVSAPADGFRIGNNTVKFGGFVKADFIASNYDGGDPGNGDLLRDFYLPGSIPVGGADESTATDFNARQTRFWLTTEGLLGGRKVGTRVEMDFQVLPGAGDQRTTSPSNLSLRRAFVTVDNWLFGQEWSNFQNIGVLPDTADYIGASEGTVFARQVQVRYTRGPFSISVENPETTVTPFLAAGRIIADDNSMPDVTARYAVTRPWGEASIAGIVRQLAYETTGVGAVDSSTMGWGLSAAARIRVGEKDDLRLMLSGGEGIGRYVGLNFTNDAVLDASGELEAIGLIAGFASYRHIWTPQWRSNFTYSAQSVDNDRSLISLAANKSSQSVRGNVIWTPLPALDLGAELMFGERELESGASGQLTRLQIFAKYGF
ncbi:MAG: DcaP family trimeric outer membrane transporter [Brevundimonas sp.]|uniref:DcaP family trimeric outer membrane transporter n=1 Tax=Brevundimonas sp. TaxID=1871086 RepID=UPI00248A0401|nr:DcaP family trimeric outer membrane transporter [Brevundimonas sp.]MDI1327732.1 DcaP family trimeric outer membrane transporter [Brevundimonas sp.]